MKIFVSNGEAEQNSCTIEIMHGLCTQLSSQWMISCASSFSLKDIVICFDSCKFLLLTYISQNLPFKLYHIHHVKPLLVSPKEKIELFSSVYPDKNH